MPAFTVLNPATEEPVAEVEQTTTAAADEAIARAVAARAAWRDVAPGERAALLRSFADVVDAHIDELAALEVAGSGHPAGQARWEAGNLRDALTAWEDSQLAHKAFGNDVVEHYANGARVELAAFDAAVTDWELLRSFERM